MDPEQGREGRAVSGEERHRRWGPVGEKEEGAKPHLWMVLGGAEVVRSGGSTERGGRRRVCSGVVVLRRRKEGAAGLRGFSGAR